MWPPYKDEFCKDMIMLMYLVKAAAPMDFAVIYACHLVLINLQALCAISDI